jgi:hypothetical protein
MIKLSLSRRYMSIEGRFAEFGLIFNFSVVRKHTILQKENKYGNKINIIFIFVLYTYRVEKYLIRSMTTKNLTY